MNNNIDNTEDIISGAGAAQEPRDITKEDACRGEEAPAKESTEKCGSGVSEADDHEAEGRTSLKKELLSWLKIILIAVAIAFVVTQFIIINAVVPSGSMEPTIMTGSRMVGFRLEYIFAKPKRGDIVIFKYPLDESTLFVKRLIGLPGETVEIKDGVTYIDGVLLEEDYLAETPYSMDFGPYEVPEGCYFVMGDNRNHSNDARYWTMADGTPVNYISEKAILGKALFVYWPLGKVGTLK